ncbi:hypothetical protein BJV82DRAFT_208337 [Fennellomyces sp. T-0311]|nr:hypothetical protein BJV82DRAFT_208337 [Fennellomyces sp. T-0311]
MEPILNTVKLVEQQLSQQGTNFVDCPPNILALLMVEPITLADNTFSISLVQRMISVKGYENDRARKYVLERLKELVKRSRYHIITEPGLPTDSEIILHIFNTFLEFSAPNVVPILVPLQGNDVYKFLLIYFYTTEDLKNEIFE